MWTSQRELQVRGSSREDYFNCFQNASFYSFSVQNSINLFILIKIYQIDTYKVNLLF